MRPTTGSVASTAPPTAPPASTVEESDTEDSERIADLERELAWKDDLHSLLNQVDRIHPNPFWRISQGEFDNMAAFLWADIDLRFHDTDSWVPIISNPDRAKSRVVLAIRIPF